MLDVRGCQLPRQVYNGAHIGRPDESVYPGVAVFEGGNLVDKAAHQRQAQFRPAPLEPLQGCEPAHDLVLGTLPDYTGIEQDQVSVLRPVGLTDVYHTRSQGKPNGDRLASW